MNNRNPIKQWSITFPQSGLMERREFALQFPPQEAIIVSRETHADGNYHLHAGLKLKKGLTKKKMLDWIKKKFPNDFKRIDVQPTRSIKCWSDYISKEDPEAYRVEDKGYKDRLLEHVRQMCIRDVGYDPENPPSRPVSPDKGFLEWHDLTDDDFEIIKKSKDKRALLADERKM